MTEVTFITSLQGRQAERVRRISESLKERRPDLRVAVLEGEEQTEAIGKLKLHYGPIVMIDGKLQYVGIPSLRMLLDRLDLIARKAAETKRAGAPPVAEKTSQS